MVEKVRINRTERVKMGKRENERGERKMVAIL